MSGVSKKIPLPHWQKVMDQAGWDTASDIAKATNIPVSTVHDAIYGRKNPSNETIIKIATVANVRPEDLAAEVFNYVVAAKMATFNTIR
jgi:predicted transcriptional regulator